MAPSTASDQKPRGSFILAIDQGTTGSTALLVDENLEVRAQANMEFPQYYPKPGWVEHDLEEIWNSVWRSIAKALEKVEIDPKEIAALSVTNQRETLGVWDRKTGKPLRKAIVWQCRRSEKICNELKETGKESSIQIKTGLLCDPYFSGSKIRWLMEEEPELRSALEKGSAALGTMDTFVISRLCGGESHFTEPSNACRTLLMDLQSGKWDQDLLELFRVPRSALPEIKSSDAFFGVTKDVPGLPDGIPIHGALGDQQAALFGQICFEPGQAKVTYGTGSFLLVNTGMESLKSQFKLLSSIAWKRGEQTNYCLEGAAFVAGAAVQWLRDELGLIEKASDVEALASRASLENMGELIFVPAFTGLGTPHWKSSARGMISGITRGTTSSHLARAALEGIALQNFDIAEAMGQDGQELKELRVDGGAAANNLLLEIQASLLGKSVTRPKVLETTALGSAMMAGLGVGLWSDLSDLKKAWSEDRVFEPSEGGAESADYFSDLKKRWAEAVKKL
jgi:glycerol kinase